MILNFKNKKEESTASANVVDGKLILSFPDAVSPVLWQMELAEAKASALEVAAGKEEGQHALILKTAKGEKIDIATFTSRADAVAGLMAAANALENAQGQIRSGASTLESAPTNGAAKQPKPKKNLTQAEKKQKQKRWLTGILALVVLFICFSLWASVVPRVVSTSAPNTGVVTGVTSPQNSSGVPVSADDFLSGQ